MSTRTLLIIGITSNYFVATILLLQSNSKFYFGTFIAYVSFLVLSSFYCSLTISKINRPVTFMLVLFWCYGMTLPAIFQIGNGIFPWMANSVNLDNVVPAATLNFFAIILFFFGHLSFKSKNCRADKNTLQVEASGNPIATTVIFFASACAVLYAVSKLGIEPFIATRLSTSIAFQELGLDLTSQGLLKALPSALTIAAFLIIAYQRKVLQVKTLVMKALYPLSFLLMIAANLPTNTARFLMVSIAFIVLCTTFRSVYENRRPFIYFSSPIIIYLIFPFLGSFNRQAELNLKFEVPAITDSFKSGDFDGFQSLMNALTLVEMEGYSWGGRLLSATLFAIPRDIWSGKYQPTGTDAARAADYFFLNISMPLPGELYADFGIFGVVLGLFIFGRCIAYLDYIVETGRNPQSKIELSMIGIVIAAFMPILFRGSLLAVIAIPASIIAVIVLWGLLRRVRL